MDRFEREDERHRLPSNKAFAAILTFETKSVYVCGRV